MVTKPQRLTKADTLAHWRRMDAQPTPAQTMTQVPYKHTGSTFAEDGIRITGSRQFIDSMLYVLTSLLERENNTERLQLVYSESATKETGQPTGAWTCYIQVHERGGEAKYLNTAYGLVTKRGG